MGKIKNFFYFYFYFLNYIFIFIFNFFLDFFYFLFLFFIILFNLFFLNKNERNSKNGNSFLFKSPLFEKDAQWEISEQIKVSQICLNCYNLIEDCYHCTMGCGGNFCKKCLLNEKFCPKCNTCTAEKSFLVDESIKKLVGKCSKCSFQSSFSNFILHCNSHYNSSHKNVCRGCNLSFENQNLLFEHLNHCPSFQVFKENQSKFHIFSILKQFPNMVDSILERYY